MYMLASLADSGFLGPKMIPVTVSFGAGFL